MRFHHGFTLLELMLAVAIVSILTTVAITSYQGYTQVVRRDDARHLVLLNAHRLQRCYTLEGVYNGSCATRTLSEEGYYTSTITTTPRTFIMTALPVAGTSQENDAGCRSFVYDQTGHRAATGTDSESCWP